MRFENGCQVLSWDSHGNVWKLLKKCFKIVSAASRDGKPQLDISPHEKSRIANAVYT